MASSAGARAVPPDKGKCFKCNPSKKVSTAVCVMCDNVYHVSDFNKMSGGTYLSNVLVICDNHKDLELISKFDKNKFTEEVRIGLSAIKSHEKQRVDREILHNISLNNTAKEELSVHDATILEGTDAAIKTEVTLLRQLNTELMSKNKLLEDIIEMKNNMEPKKSYFDIVKGNDVKKDSKPVPSIKICNSEIADKKDIFKEVSTSIRKHVVFPIDKSYMNKDGSTVIKCKNSEDITRTMEILNDKLGEKFKINKEELKNPRLKIVKINSEMSNDELESDINERNFFSYDNKCKVVHTYVNNVLNTRTAIIEVKPDLYCQVKINKNRIYIECESYKAYDDFNLIPCKNCGKFDHNYKKCNGETWLETQRTTQNYLNIINYWLKLNYLLLNIDKSVYITFSIQERKQPNNFTLLINNRNLKQVESYKYLGLHLDQYLRWNIHINNTVKKLRYLLSVFFRLKSILCRHMLASIYYGLFQSVATYGIVSWRSADDTYLGKLKNLQKRAISIVFGDHNQPLNIPQCYFLEALMIEYPKLKKKTLPKNWHCGSSKNKTK